MRFVALAVGSLALLSSQAVAQDEGALLRQESLPAPSGECTAPCAGYEISAELGNDWLFAADPSFLTSNVLQPTLEVGLFFAPVDYLRFVTKIVTESVVDPAPGESATAGMPVSRLSQVASSSISASAPCTVETGWKGVHLDGTVSDPPYLPIPAAVVERLRGWRRA
jgi:hypothetical protein